MKRHSLFCLLTFFIVLSAQAQLKVAEIYTSNMVLQRNQEVPVWGWAKKNSRVNVKFDDVQIVTKANKKGRWFAKLPKMEAGGPHRLEVSDKSDSFIFENILVGDVWLLSGQSNMEWTVANSNDAEEEIRNSTDPLIRHFKVPHGWDKTPQEHLEGGPWQPAGPNTTANFSAVGYYFARELRKKVDVPIGLLNSSWGGSRIEPWMRSETLGDFVEGDIDAYLVKKEEEQKAAMQELEKKVAPLLTATEIEQAKKPGFNDEEWSDVSLPGLWEEGGYVGLDGIVWLRKVINLSREEAENGLTLNLAMIDDNDWTYMNGEMVGSTASYNALRSYEVGADHLKEGENIIFIKVEDTGGGGGLYGSGEELYYKSSAGTHSLVGDWKMKVEKVATAPAAGFRPNQTATVLYNKMIAPITNFPIKGVLWYQGESNANAEGAYVYRELFKTMISDWRTLWGLGDFPFLWVQLANFMQPDATPAESSWAVLRESQSEALSLPATGEAVIIDIGEANDIHPRNKQDVGYRLSLAARKIAYDEDIVYSGPVYKDSKIEESSIIVAFDHIGSGLHIKDKYGYVKGFAIAGADKKFVWATASVIGDKIRVWSEEVTDPKYVRYAWGNNPDDANVYNAEGLPAQPFRTDSQ